MTEARAGRDARDARPVRHGRWITDNRPSFPAEVALWVDAVDAVDAVDGCSGDEATGRPGGSDHDLACGEYGFCDGRCRRAECDGACGEFGLCDGTCRLQWCDGGCSGCGYCDGTCERLRSGRSAEGRGASGGPVPAGLGLFGERGAEWAAGIRSFADLTTDEVRAWVRADGPVVRDGAPGDAPGRGLSEPRDTGLTAEPPHPRRATCPDPGPLVVVDAKSAEFAGVWPARDGGLEPRPGLLTSVVRAGGVMIYPPPLFDPRVAVAAREGVWPLRDEPPRAPAPRLPGADVLGDPAVAVEVARPADPPSQKAYIEIRQLVGVLIEVMAGRRSSQQVALWVHARVREALRDPATSRYGGTAILRRVRLSAVGAAPDTGVEALALIQDGQRMRAAAFRFDPVADPGRGTAGTTRWQCTALQTA